MAKIRLPQLVSFRRLKVWQKCALIAVPFLFPIVFLTSVVVRKSNDAIDNTKRELRALEMLRPIKQLSRQLTQHRANTREILNGAAERTAERNRAAADVDASLNELDAALAADKDEFKLAGRVAAVRDEWGALRAAVAGYQVGEDAVSFQRHNALIAKVFELSRDIAELAGLALDSQVDAYYLQSILTQQALTEADAISQIRGKANAVLLRAQANNNDLKNTLTLDERIYLAVLLSQIDDARSDIRRQIDSAVRYNPRLAAALRPAFDEHTRQVDAYVALVREELLGADTVKQSQGVYYDKANAAAAAAYKLFDAIDPLLVELLTERVSRDRYTNWTSIAGIAVGLMVVGVVVLVVTRSITRQVDGLSATFAKIEAGDYTTRVAVASEDELGAMAGSLNKMLDNTLVLIQSRGEKEEIQRSIMKLLDEVSGVGTGDLTKDVEVSADITGAIADSFNYTVEELRKIISRVQSATRHVSSAATEIHSSAEHLAGGSETQAEQIVNMSAAIDEMATSIQQVSDNAAVSTTVAQQALQNAKQGNTAVRNTIDSMNRIREQAQETAKRIKRLGETSQEIGQIVQLIDDIADRTSILALNASIQAAAAGDAGRGFAVVAEEVERLAVRSTEATKKISVLVRAIQGETNEAVAAMERSIQEVVGGSKVANQAGQSLGEIEDVAAKLADLIQSISLASKQQARGSESLARSMSDVSQITQSTAAGTKQTAEAVNELARLADDLRGSLSAFRLPAHMMVQAEPAAPAGKNGTRKKQLA
ncbi:Methyl-accepting chemotaxis protein PctC [Gemmata obscuriglobus]|uniref:HAMP domain-containing protein n=1 Tax=Gemmata obscuriglobus TaxID=114 RepID=A0A2Z3GXJ9_9BACT|nr:HAMP domain-containing methyl-accepting chemotaxis protein [Gemmata obscuriglobus]AWM35655.1 HAMP domain-containing protein [Gemmata obscuriglobus]QEG31817.1 Methyl-accepting chemotaxis protein PctC [Gemmata obscuriglobus]VTS11163.1 chemotaxis protein : Methyl-accepting chemotaxis sensory transducer OS=Isosphaera pallida (strain ATCC 43644 / DSM 9630 / IS1B) GN=Isop_3689 PE=4 SV=1: HAMP: MCPsignal [Gemmata obscuriglobus UQM 2246]